MNKNKNKKQKNLFAIITSTCVIVAIGIIATIVIINQPKQIGADDNPNATVDAEPFTTSPKNMIQDAITVGANDEIISTTNTGEELDQQFAASPYVPREDGKATVKIFFDPQCPVCKLFEETNNETVKEFLNNDTIVVEYHPISFLDNASTNQYSSRATNALACVADEHPQNFVNFFDQLFLNQTPEGGAGLSNGQIYALTQKAGIEENTQLETCIYSQQFLPWVAASTTRALTETIPSTDNGSVNGTPTIFINGDKLDIAPNDGEGFRNALENIR